MGRTVTLEDGTELELPDNIVEEIQNEKAQAITEEYGDPAELKQQLEDLGTEKTDLEEQIRVAAEKGENASKLREQLKTKEKELVDAKGAVETASSTSNNLLIDEWKDKAISAVTDDPETKKLFEAKYALLSNMPVGSKVEIQARIDSALDLTQPGWRGGMDTTAFDSGSARGAKAKETTQFNDAQRDVAAQLGLSAEDLERYGGKRG